MVERAAQPSGVDAHAPETHRGDAFDFPDLPGQVRVDACEGDETARIGARKFVDFTLSPDAQNINAKLKINSIPSNKNSLLSPDAPKFAEMKLIDYDTPRWGSPAERSRLLKKFDTDVKALPR